jgi:nucleotide-binding universal stress UspA family protein
MEVLEETKKKLKEQYPTLKLETRLETGHPARKIVEVSDSDDINIIVIGSRGYGGFTGWFLGSVSNYVVNNCKKPVLVIK